MAELALAIVPIFFGAVRGFSIIREKTHLLRHYHKEIRRLRDKVDVQSRCFRGEVYHVIIDTLDDQTAQFLIRDDDHAYWKNPDLEGTLGQHLGELRPDFWKAIQEVKMALTHIETRLAVFAEPDVTSPLFQATKDRFRLMFKKEEYKEDIKLLKEWIAELKRIRKLAHKIRKSAITIAKEKKKEDTPVDEVSEEANLGTVKYFRSIRHFSAGLQSLVQRQWTCSNASHSCHNSRLLIGSIWQPNSVLWLFESSGRHGSTSLNNRILFNVASQQLGLLTPESLGRRSFDEFEAPSPKRQRISPQSHLFASSAQTQFTAIPADDVQALCQQLEGCGRSLDAQAFSHVDLQTRERFHFESKEIGDWAGHVVASAAQLLGQSVDMILNRERIQLALGLVKGAMVNHSTPAWPQGCVLEGISYLQDPQAGIDLSAAVSTLNIRVQLGGCADMDDTVEMDMESGSVVSEEELHLTYGIRNRILYRLGVALLSIGLWTKIDWTDIAAVRRKAEALDSLGEKYRDVVKRLIWGNFGVDTTDLADERLQAEILRTVIGPLEKRAVSRRQRRIESAKLGDGGGWIGEASRAFPVR